MPISQDSKGLTFILHPNGQRTHYILTPCSTRQEPTSTILIQHGFGRHAAFWEHWIPALSLRHDVIRRDLRGHGHSSYASPTQKPTYAYDIGTVVGEMVDMLDQLNLAKVHFLGESTSGMLGEILAATHPDRLLSLTVCSTPTHLPPAALQLFAFGRRDWATACRELGARGWAEALSRVPGTVPVSDPEYLTRYLDEIAVSDGEGLAQYAEFLSTLDARPFLRRIRVPTLILAPTQSAAVKVEDMETLAKTIEGSRLVLVDGPGHEIYVTQADKCQEAFLGFLRDLRIDTDES